ncbi:MAG: restriction endonuclease subunit S [Anaerovoracaceae bacterium]
MSNYKQHRAGDLFQIQSNPQLNKESFKFTEKGYPYFTRTAFDNGILGYVEYLDEEHKISGNSLAIGMIEMRFHYMEHDFYAGQFTKTAFPKFDGFNKLIALYFICLFGKYQSAFQGVLVRDFENLFSNLQISLPTTKSGKVDFMFIERYMSELEIVRIQKLETHLNSIGIADNTITHDEQKIISAFRTGAIKNKSFSLHYLFYKKEMTHEDSRAYRVKKRDILHDVAGVVAKYDDNGVMYWVKEGEFKFTPDQDGITVIANGAVASGRVFYQEHKYTILNDAYTIKLKAKEVIGRDLGLYLALAIEKRLFSTYSWENKPTWDKVKNDTIELPVDMNGNPNYEYMSRFMRIQKKLAIKNVIDWKEKEKAACRVATAN